jgi:hypothetical protein
LVPFSRESDRAYRLRSALGGTAAALAILSHAASALVVLAVFTAAIYVFKSTRRSESNPVSALERVRAFGSRWRWVFVAVLASIVVLSPWLRWRKFEFPSSNALPKYFLTGSFGFETPNESVIHTALRFYHTLTLKQWLESKLLGLATLGGFYHGDLHNPLGTFTNLSGKLGSVRAARFTTSCLA